MANEPVVWMLPSGIYPPYMASNTTYAAETGTLTFLQNEVLRLLHESTNSKVLAVGTGAGADASGLTNADGLTNYLNDAQDFICRTCYPLPARGTVEWYPIGQRLYAIRDIPPVDDDVPNKANLREIWAVTAAYWNGSALTHVALPVLRARIPNFEYAAHGTPAYWYTSGEGYIGLYPAPATQKALGVYGYGLPKNLGDGTGTTVTSASWASAGLLVDVLTKLCAVAAARINYDDPSLFGRAEIWEAEVAEEMHRLWTQIDPWLRLPNALFFSEPKPVRYLNDLQRAKVS